MCHPVPLIVVVPGQVVDLMNAVPIQHVLKHVPRKQSPRGVVCERVVVRQFEYARDAVFDEPDLRGSGNRVNIQDTQPEPTVCSRPCGDITNELRIRFIALPTIFIDRFEEFFKNADSAPIDPARNGAS